MKLIVWTILCSVVISVPVRGASRVEIGVSVSRSDDYDLFDEIAGGYGPGLNLRWYVHDRFSAGLNIAAFESDIADEGVFGERLGSMRWYPVSLLAHVHFRPSARLHPYLGAGSSYVFSDSSVPRFDVRQRLSLTGGLGATFDLDSRWRLSVDARWLPIDGTKPGGDWSSSQVLTSFGVGFRSGRHLGRSNQNHASSANSSENPL